MKKLVESVYLREDLKNELKMNVVFITPTHNCNYDCHYCSDSKNKINKNAFLDLSGLKVFLENYKRFSEKDTMMTLLGGEPMLNKDIKDYIIEFNKHENIKIIKIVSNGAFDAQKYVDLHKIVGDKLELNISFHPSGFKKIDHYIELTRVLTENNINFQIRYMIDNLIDLDFQIKEFKTFKEYCPIVKIDSLFGVIYKQEYIDFLKINAEQENNKLKLTYDDGSSEEITVAEMKLMKNPYKGMYCGSLFTKFVLTVDLKFMVFCKEDSKINALNYSEFRKLKKQLYENTCKLDRCVCYMFFKKSINKLTEL
mgnify:CR=1 FL=1